MMKTVKRIVFTDPPKNDTLVLEDVDVYYQDEYIEMFHEDVKHHNVMCMKCGEILGEKDNIPNPEIFIIKNKTCCKECSGTEHDFKGFGFLLRAFTFTLSELDYQVRLDENNRRTGEDERDRWYARNRLFHLS